MCKETRDSFLRIVAEKVLDRKREISLDPLQNEIANIQLLCEELRHCAKFNGWDFVRTIIDPQHKWYNNLTGRKTAL